VTVLGGTEQGNLLQGSLGLSVNTVTFSNGSTGVVATDYPLQEILSFPEPSHGEKTEHLIHHRNDGLFRT
jgi:hypothetical protein